MMTAAEKKLIEDGFERLAQRNSGIDKRFIDSLHADGVVSERQHRKAFPSRIFYRKATVSLMAKYSVVSDIIGFLYDPAYRLTVKDSLYVRSALLRSQAIVETYGCALFKSFEGFDNTAFTALSYSQLVAPKGE